MSEIMYTRLEGESDSDLIIRIVQDKDKIGTWDDVATVLNMITGNTRSESFYRKRYKKLSNGNEITVESPVTVSDRDNEIVHKMRELEIKKIQYRDERNAWQKQNYSAARIEEFLNKLETELKSIGSFHFKPTDTNADSRSNREMIICLSDLHIGQYFDNYFGKYNYEIAQKRLSHYLNKVTEIQKIYSIDKARIVLLGDMISGNIHHTIQVTNQEDVISQIKKATELISAFCYGCCEIFNQVIMYDVCGNHSRIDLKDKAIHDDRLDSIISWATSLLLNNVPNFSWKQTEIDSGISNFEIHGIDYVAVHGDYDDVSGNGISKLGMTIGYMPDVIIRGHNHSPSSAEINGIQIVQSGSLPGSGDQRTVEKRLTGNPSQTILICDDDGVECIYNVKLNII